MSYAQALAAAALLPDLAILPHGDETEIGERGINLSGGQKARVAIARAFYAANRCQIFLFDDPFSAVDGATGNHIFDEGICKLLKGSLRVVALNSHLHLLRRFDRVVVLEHGRVAASGSLAALSVSHPDLLQRVLGESLQQQTAPDTASELVVETVAVPLDVVDVSAPQAIDLAGDESAPQSKRPAETVNKKLIQEEKVFAGAVSAATYVKYFSAAAEASSQHSQPLYAPRDPSAQFQAPQQLAAGVAIILGVLSIFSCAQLARIAVDLFLARWAENSNCKRNSDHSTMYYVSFGVLIALLLVRALCLNIFSVRSSTNIHSGLLRSVLAASVPLFFDTHTLGEILNRFAKDSEVVDSSVPEFMLQALINWAQVLSIFGLCLWTSPWFALVLGPLFFIFFQIFQYFSCVSRDLKRLESASRSPIYSSLAESLLGLETIRAFGDTGRFLALHEQRMSRNLKFFYHLWMAMCWVTVRLEIGTACVLLAIALLAVCARDLMSPVTLGLALSFGLQLTALFQRCVQLLIEISTYMTSTERLFEYLDTPSEAVDEEASAVPDSWPKTGRLSFSNVWLQYRDNPAALRGVALELSAGQRVGICGRTGAGKSSLLLALFRVVELSRGTICLDDVDIRRVSLQRLRSSMAIIPQDPVLFLGTIRFQLDPFSQHPDSRIWQVLSQVSMSDAVRAMRGGLQELVRENGENLSQGQRQLLCIARALLKDTKILVIDEGTSAVDPHTDELIQSVLREEVASRGECDAAAVP